jgi:photosystem II stability/assembly factor-like uncharacterized protein
MKIPLKNTTLSAVALSAMIMLTVNSCLRDPYGDSEIMIPEIPGWEITSTGHNLGANLRRMLFVTAEKGYVIGYNGFLMHTADSGRTWTEQDAGTDLNLGNIYFVDENTGFISGRGSDDCLNEDCGKGSFLLRTLNGGATWEKIFYDTLAYAESMIWRDALNGLAIMEHRLPSGTTVRSIARSDDGGTTWEMVSQPFQYTAAPLLTEAGNVYYIAGDDAIVRSTDYGATWQPLQTPPHLTGGWFRIHFNTATTGFIADNSAVYRTTDGGDTWQRTDSDMAWFDAMHFYNGYEGFCFNVMMQYQGGDWPVIVGSYVYSTTDGGMTWLKSNLYRNFYAGSVSFPTDEVGYGINGSSFHRFVRN